MSLSLAETMLARWQPLPTGRIAWLTIPRLMLKLTASDDGKWAAYNGGTDPEHAGHVPVVDSRRETMRLAQVAATEYLLTLLDEGARQARAALLEAAK